MKPLRIVFALTTCGMLLSASGRAADDLAAGFAAPPPSARPWVYWFWMDGNLSREGMTADLEAMRAAGLGGMIVMEVDVGIPRGPVEFMSPPWQSLFAHASHEAERLGLQITVNAGPGWTGSGGPWVKPEDSMQHLVASETTIEGPTHFDAVLPRPQPRKPFFGEETLTPELHKAWQQYYRDVAVLAFPATTGAARIADLDEKSLVLRAPYSSSQPPIRPFLPAPADYSELPAAQCVARDQVVDLTAQMDAAGRLVWDVPAGRWTVLRFVRTSTGQNTRPAPAPGLGFESDKFSAAALDAHFDHFVGALLRAIGPRDNPPRAGLTSLHIDSWEMGAQNWSEHFAEEFRQRRGYDPLPLLPVMAGQVVSSLEVSERFLWDLRQTAQELVLQHHALRLRELAHRHGLGLSIEPYDMNPCSDLSLGSAADVPMCEFWAQDHGFATEFSCIEAVSIGQALGRPIVAAEAFTSVDSEAWRLYPGAMKNQTDWALGAGINRIVFHRFAHQPWLDRQPGMTMGPYGVHWDRTQTWWDLVPAYHAYLARCQFLLRQGTGVADIAYLALEGAPHVFRAPPSAVTGILPDRREYNFVGLAPEWLAGASVKDGRIVLTSGASYRVLVLPLAETMTPGLLNTIGSLIRAGATVVGPPPRKSPSLSGFPECDHEIRSLAAAIWGSDQADDAIGRPCGAGRIIGVPLPRPSAAASSALEQLGAEATISRPSESLYPPYEETATLLSRLGLPPDFHSSGPIRYTHRQLQDGDIYFVANRESRVVETDCTFRARGRTPECWDPLAGKIRVLPDFRATPDGTTVPLRFDPHQSYFVVFRSPAGGTTERNAQNFAAETTVLSVAGPWQVHFDPKRGGPGSATLETLEDWSQRPEEGIRHYAGIATYRTRFDLPAEAARRRDLRISLGTVHVMARVRLNGHDLGTVWCAPWSVEIGDRARENGNQLEIDVANLWPNRLIGDQRLPADQRISWTTWNPYTQDAALLPSGLLGPVTVRALRAQP